MPGFDACPVDDMRVLLWVCAAAAAYSYVIYPTLLLILPRYRTPLRGAGQAIRHVAVVIAARNEVARMREKLANTLSLDRAGMILDVLVASDASDDGTDRVVEEHQSVGVKLIRSDIRRGKEYAQGLALQATTAELIVFTDAGTLLPPDALVTLERAFRDPDIGAVSSVDKFLTADGSLEGEGAYIRYEMWLRDLESRYFSLVGLSGSFFAARPTVCQCWDTSIPSDFGTALACVRMGLRAISDRSVQGFYRNLADPSKEYQRKVRTVTRGMTGLLARREALNFLKYGRFSFQLLSHKVMRWLAPLFLLGALVSSCFLAIGSPVYRLILGLQLFLYLSPLMRRLSPRIARVGLIRLAVYFVEVNVAMLHAMVLALSGRSIIAWEPSRR